MSAQKLATAATRQINAVVVSAGLMEKTVKVRIGTQKWNNHIRKVYPPILPTLNAPSSTLYRLGSDADAGFV